MGLTAGERFAGFRVIRLLGSGGMGQVYLVAHPRLPRQEALKVLSAELSNDPAYRIRFAREADLAAKLWHPNIVEVRDRGETDGQLWISMAYVEGQDAAHLLETKYPAGMPVEVALPIVEAVAAALDYAHAQGLLHRDVKPANIFLSAPSAGGDTRILLGDFGIARELADTDGVTATNMTLGTVAYAAPEQLSGEPLDGRADQYALAATAYKLLTGKALFAATNPVAVISRHLTAAPPKISAAKPALAGLDAVLDVALSKSPGDRFPRCTDFARALGEAAKGGGASSTAPTQQARATLGPPRPAVPPRPAGPAAAGPAGRPAAAMPAPGLAEGGRGPAKGILAGAAVGFGGVLLAGALIGVVLGRNGSGGGDGPPPRTTSTQAAPPTSSAPELPQTVARSSVTSPRPTATATTTTTVGREVPWFASRVGNATQVVSVTGTGGSAGSMDLWERVAGGWQPATSGIPVLLGSAGLAAQARDDVPATPMGIYSLDFAFGSQPNPGGGLKYVQTTPDHWWSAEGATYNSMQVCKPAACPFDTSPSGDSENLWVPAYRHAIVMGVNEERIPGRGGGFFIQSSRGVPTAGGIAVDDATLVGVIRWLQPGAMIAIETCRDDRCSE